MAQTRNPLQSHLSIAGESEYEYRYDYLYCRDPLSASVVGSSEKRIEGKIMQGTMRKHYNQCQTQVQIRLIEMECYEIDPVHGRRDDTRLDRLVWRGYAM
jgi:hypothetical protein